MNKFRILVIGTSAMVLFLQLSLSAQNNQNDYVVLYAGDTIFGNVQYIKESGANRKFLKKIKLTTLDGKRERYKRKEVATFKIGNTIYESFWLNQTSQHITLINPKYNIDAKDGEQHFLKAISKGKLSHYELEWFEQENTTLWSMALLKKEKDPFFIRANQGLLGLKRKVLSKYFFDCPEIIKEIKAKKLNRVWQVVDFYNSHCIY